MNVSTKVYAFIFSMPAAALFSYRSSRLTRQRLSSISRTILSRKMLSMPIHDYDSDNYEEAFRSALLLQEKKATLPEQNPATVRCVILSDTHGRHNELPPLPHGDVLIHLGDVADKGSLSDIQSFCQYLAKQSHPEKIVLEGNHDRDLNHPNRIDLESEYRGFATLLKDEMLTVAGGQLHLYGASWEACESDNFDDVHALDVNKQQEKEVDQQHQNGIDFLLTHGCPSTKQGGHGWTGSEKITQIVQQYNIPIHLFGHVHWGRGIQQPTEKNIMVNCATSWNQPVVVDWDPITKRVVLVHCPSPQIVERNGRLRIIEEEADIRNRFL